MEYYLDNAATTKVMESSRNIMNEVMEKDYGNPSSLHRKGFESERYVTDAKKIIAKTLKAKSQEIIFTSGGTESNNLALIGAALANKRKGMHIISSSIEHASIYNTLFYLEEMGFRITLLPADKNGKVSLEALSEAICEDTILVSIMYVNNEIGTVEPIEEIGRIIKEKNQDILFHVDAIQAYGKYRIFPNRLNIDLLSVSGHKIHAPKGSGFLFVKEKTKVKPILYGGGQQKGMRPGTENVPAIAGLSKAVESFYEEYDKNRQHMYAIKRHFLDGISKLEGITVNGFHELDLEETAPHIVNVGFSGIRSEVLLHALEEKGIYVSSGSACSSNHPGISSTLKAIGVNNEMLECALRFSFSVYTTKKEVEYTLMCLEELIPILRRYQRK